MNYTNYNFDELATKFSTTQLEEMLQEANEKLSKMIRINDIGKLTTFIENINFILKGNG